MEALGRSIAARAALVAASAAFASMAARAETVFGLEIGARLSLPECVAKVTAGRAYYEILQPTTCLEPAASKVRDHGEGARYLIFAKSEWPQIAKSPVVIALLEDGNLVGIEFSTQGIQSQSLVMEALTAKFGPSDSDHAVTAQNALGAQFVAHVVDWKRGTLTIHFAGVEGGRLDLGRVDIDTPASLELRRQWAAQAPEAKQRAL
jgi:hypothetical protein